MKIQMSFQCHFKKAKNNHKTEGNGMKIQADITKPLSVHSLSHAPLFSPYIL